MQDRKGISLEEAIERCCFYCLPLTAELVKVEEALYRVVATEVLSRQQVPSFYRSRVDGFTVTEPDLIRLGAGEYLDLQVIDVVAAGYTGEAQFSPGQTVRIMTGAIIPSDTAAVIKQEDVKNLGNSIRVSGAADFNQYIEPPGSVIESGERIVGSGQTVDAEVIERLASAGETRLNVYRLPRVYIINCGDELCLPGQTLQRGQIYHSNRNFLLAKVDTINCTGILGNIGIGDNVKLIRTEIERGLKKGDILIISGGTAQGKYDLVSAALEELGAEFLFHSINSKPGRNISCSLLSGHLIFNLPGNPSAGGIMFDLLLAPVLRKIRGQTDYNHNWLKLRLSDDISPKRPTRSFRRGELVQDGSTLLARPLPKHEKDTKPFPLLLDIEAGKGEKGEIVRAVLLKN